MFVVCHPNQVPLVEQITLALMNYHTAISHTTMRIVQIEFVDCKTCQNLIIVVLH